MHEDREGKTTKDGGREGGVGYRFTIQSTCYAAELGRKDGREAIRGVGEVGLAERIGIY